MVLVLLFCILLIVITIIFFLIILSTLKIEVKNYEVSNMFSKLNSSENNESTSKNLCKSDNKINAKHKIKVSLNVLDKLKIWQLKLNSEKIKKITLKMHLDRIDIKKLEKEIRIDDIKEIIQIKPKISYMDLSIKVGIDDVLLTTYAVPVLCTLISILLPLVVEKNSHKKIKYDIKPIYNNGNMYDVKFDIGIKIKVLKLLNAMYIIYKNRKKSNHKKNITYRRAVV